jgi:hypothetical protein
VSLLSCVIIPPIVRRWRWDVLWSSKHLLSTLRAVAHSGGGGCQVPSSSHCPRPRAPSIVIWGHCGSCPCSSSSSSPIVLPWPSLSCHQCRCRWHPPLSWAFFVWVSLSPPSSPNISRCCSVVLLLFVVLVGVLLLFSPSLVVIVPICVGALVGSCIVVSELKPVTKLVESRKQFMNKEKLTWYPSIIWAPFHSLCAICQCGQQIRIPYLYP